MFCPILFTEVYVKFSGRFRGLRFRSFVFKKTRTLSYSLLAEVSHDEPVISRNELINRDYRIER